MEVGSKEVVKGLLVWFPRVHLWISCLHNIKFMPQLIAPPRERAESERKGEREEKRKELSRTFWPKAGLKFSRTSPAKSVFGKRRLKPIMGTPQKRQAVTEKEACKSGVQVGLRAKDEMASNHLTERTSVKMLVCRKRVDG